MKRVKKPLEEKVTIGKFFSMQFKIIKELYTLYKLQTVGIIFTSGLLVFQNYIDLKFLEYMTNRVFSYGGGESNDSFISVLYTAGIFLFTLLLFKLFSNLNNTLYQKYNSNISTSVDKKLVKKISSISYEYYESTPIYEKINLAYKASSQYPNAVWGITQIVNIIVLLVMYGTILSKISPLFTVLIFLSIFLCIVFSVKVTDLQLDFWRKKVSPETRRNNYFKGIFGSRVNHSNIQLNRSFSFFARKYEYFNIRERKNYVKLNMFSFCTEIGISLLFMIVFCIIAIFIGDRVARGHLQLGYFTMTMTMMFNLFSTVKQFSYFMLNQNWYIKVLDAYFEVMSLQEHSTNFLEPSRDKIIVEDLVYKYPQSENPALQNISIDFKMGEKIAIVGKNGSGKSTFISILMELLENYEGRYIKNDKEMVAILQDFVQYQMSVKENIEVGCGGKELSEERVSEILKDIGLYDAVTSLPDGMYTKLGQLEDGVELSKGQWQRVAIGRLLANEKARVWILDEPTAYLDPIAEIRTYQLICDIARDRLVFFISHRLGFAKKADRILVINEGKIQEEGNHNELMKKNGLYAEMFSAQREWYI